MNSKPTTVYGLVFQMPDTFTVDDVVSRAKDRHDVEVDSDEEWFRAKVSVFLESLVALGILRQRREHWFFTDSFTTSLNH